MKQNDSDLHVKPVPDEDAEAFRAMLDEPEVARNTGSIPKNPDMAWTLQRLADRRRIEAETGEMVDRGVYLGETLVGMATFFRNKAGEIEIGYLVHADWRGRGIATYACHAAIALARCFGHTGTLVAAYAKDNPSSGRVLEKAGFKPDGEGSFTSLGRGGDIDCWRMRLEP